MDLGLSESQQMLKNSSREFLERECPTSFVRAMEEDSKGYTPELWKKIADLGWLGLPFPEEYGGLGLSYLDLTILLEEMGRVLFPGTFFSSVLLGGLTTLTAGSTSQKKEALPRIAQGDAIATLALMEPSAEYGSGGIQTKASLKDSSYVLNGTKLFIPDAHVADKMVVVARTGGSGEDGITLFLVDGKATGVTSTVLKTIAADKQCEVKFEDVAVGADAVLGEVGGGWATMQQLQRRATVAYCAYLVGLAQRDFEISVDYAKERIQFGRPIGSFQAIQHKAADMVTDVDGSRFIMYRAAWAVNEDEADQDLQVSMAKAWCSDASRRVVAHGQQIHGGIGFTKEYIIQLYFRRQKMAELMWGDGEYHREKVADLLAI